MSTENEMIMRPEWEAYMKTEIHEPGIHLIGEGFSSFSESKNPKEYNRQYINQYTETTDIVGYSPSIAYTVDGHTAEPAVCEVMAIADRELRKNDARRIVYTVNTWDKDTSGYCTAWERTFAIIPDGKGDGNDALIYTGTFKAVSDAKEIKWDMTKNAPATDQS